MYIYHIYMTGYFMEGIYIYHLPEGISHLIPSLPKGLTPWICQPPTPWVLEEEDRPKKPNHWVP